MHYYQLIKLHQNTKTFQREILYHCLFYWYSSMNLFSSFLFYLCIFSYPSYNTANNHLLVLYWLCYISNNSNEWVFYNNHTKPNLCLFFSNNHKHYHHKHVFSWFSKLVVSWSFSLFFSLWEISRHSNKCRKETWVSNVYVLPKFSTKENLYPQIILKFYSVFYEFYQINILRFYKSNQCKFNDSNFISHYLLHRLFLCTFLVHLFYSFVFSFFKWTPFLFLCPTLLCFT